MGYLFKKTVVRKIPVSATITERKRKPTASELKDDPSLSHVVELVAKWKDRSGDTVSGIVIDNIVENGRVRMKSNTWMIGYTDANGRPVQEVTSFREKTSAAGVLSEREKTVELIKRGVVTESELQTVTASGSTIDEHIEAYLKSLANKRGNGKRERVSEKHLVNARRCLKRIVSDCKFKSIQDIKRERVSQWVTDRLNDAELDWSARTINTHTEVLKAFCAWCASPEQGRAKDNRLAGYDLLGDDPKKPRRALTLDEIGRLLTVARLRPIAEFGRLPIADDSKSKPMKNGRMPWKLEPLTYDTIHESYERGLATLKSESKIHQLKRLGEEREVLYSVLLSTGLRKSELASITLGGTHVDESPAWLELSHHSDKAGRGGSIPVRDDIAKLIRQHISNRRQDRQAANKETIPVRSTATRDDLNERLFRVPDNLVGILNRDLAAAQIEKVDGRGRRVDVHAMRHTFATMLTASGVSPRVAQEAMRHSSIEMTMKLYTDTKLLDITGAVESLPTMAADYERMKAKTLATGTNDASSVAVTVAVNDARPCVGMLKTSGFDAGKKPAERNEESQKIHENHSVFKENQQDPDSASVRFIA